MDCTAAEVFRGNNRFFICAISQKDKLTSNFFSSSAVFPQSCVRVRALTDFRLRTRIDLLRTDILLHRHIVVDHKITTIRDRKLFEHKTRSNSS